LRVWFTQYLNFSDSVETLEMHGQEVFVLFSLGDPAKESLSFNLKCQPKRKPYFHFILGFTFELSEDKWSKY